MIEGKFSRNKLVSINHEILIYFLDFAKTAKRVVQINAEAVAHRCSITKIFRKFRKIHRKTPVPESPF